MRREIRNFQTDSLEIRAKEGEKPEIVGHAAVFNKDSLPIMGFFVERILPGAFDRTLSDGHDIFAFNSHDPSQVLGRNNAGTLELSVDNTGLMTRTTPPDTGFARDLMTSIRRKDVSRMSFGFSIPDGGERWTPGGGPDGLDLRELLDVDLGEVSPTAMAAYLNTDVAMRSFRAWKDSIRQPVPSDAMAMRAAYSFSRSRL